MRKSIYLMSFVTLVLFNFSSMIAQDETWSLVYPNGKTKALVLSFDDGLIQDKQMIEILNKYQIKGTFNINSGKLGKTEDWLVEMTGKPAVFVKSSELNSIYKGHELASHTLNHPYLQKLSKAEMLYEVNKDIKNIEEYAGYKIKSFAYPFGTYNDTVVSALSKTQLSNARTVNNTYGFGLPDSFLLWHPTCHHNEAYKFIEQFRQTNQPLAVFYIWGHSWEFDYNKEYNSWTYFESICKKLSNHENVWYATVGELCDYLAATKLLFEKDGVLFNNSFVTIFVEQNNKVRSLKAGQKIKL